MNVGYRLAALALLSVLACNSQHKDDSSDGTAWGVGSFASNGERIYFTATSDRGTPIEYSGGPSMTMMMMGGKLACVSCHGVDARGGSHVMHMQVMNAPNIRWSALSHGHHGEGHSDEEESAEHHEGYTFEDFRRAVEDGRHPDGDKLSGNMPRWRMSAEDLRDLMDYLKSL
jgi:hypothetical protein